jgi:hypothetical protein
MNENRRTMDTDPDFLRSLVYRFQERLEPHEATRLNDIATILERFQESAKAADIATILERFQESAKAAKDQEKEN